MTVISEGTLKKNLNPPPKTDRPPPPRSQCAPSPETARLREALMMAEGTLSKLMMHCEEMEARNHDYHGLAEDGVPYESKSLANAAAALSTIRAALEDK